MERNEQFYTIATEIMKNAKEYNGSYAIIRHEEVDSLRKNDKETYDSVIAYFKTHGIFTTASKYRIILGNKGIELYLANNPNAVKDFIIRTDKREEAVHKLPIDQVKDIKISRYLSIIAIVVSISSAIFSTIAFFS